MLKEFVEKLLELKRETTVRVNDAEYSTVPLTRINIDTAESLNVSTLKGFVDYLNSEFDVMANKVIVHIESPISVYAATMFNNDLVRNVMIKALAEIPRFNFDTFYDAEPFNIALQSKFVDVGDRADVLRVVGNIKEENVRTIGDDGVSQSVTAKIGVATVGEVVVPNPVTLAPYRTFTEVEQPSSEFVLRLSDGAKCGVFEADGGAWKMQAVENIRNYLSEHLSGRIAADKIVIIS